MTNKEKIDYYRKRIELSRLLNARILREWEAWERAVTKVYGKL